MKKITPETSGAVLWNDLCDVYEDAVSWIRQQPEDEQDWTIVDRLHKLIEAAPDGEKAVRDHEVAALLARAERAEAVVAALPDPSTAEELREKITELLDSPNEALIDAFLGYAWSETARIAGGEMTARWQAEDTLKTAEAERDVLATQMAAIRTLITEDYGADYDDEDVPAAIETVTEILATLDAPEAPDGES